MGTVTFNAANLILLDDGESLTGWTGVGDTMSDLETDFFQQGSSCVAGDAKATGLRGVIHDWVNDGGSAVDFTVTDRHLFCWVWTLSPKLVQTRANGGARIRVSSTSGGLSNYEEWYIGGSDVAWTGNGWHLVVLDIANEPSQNVSGTLDRTQVRAVGFLCNYTGTAARANATAMDVIRYGTYLEATGGTASDPITLQDIVDQDQAGGGDTYYGMLTPTRVSLTSLKFNGRLTIGDVSGAVNTVFLDKSRNVFAEDQPCAKGFTGLTVLADSGTTDFTIGTKIGTGDNAIGSLGINFFNDTTIYPKDVYFTASGANVNTFKLYGTNFDSWTGLLSLGTASTALGGSGDTVELIDSSAVNCGRIIRNIGATNILLRNSKISFNKNYRASLDIVDGLETDANRLNYVQSSGFIDTKANASPVTFVVRDFNFDQALVPYVNITDADETWDIINGTITLEENKMKQIEFVDTPTVTDNGEVTAASFQPNNGAQRNTVRTSGGVIYFVLTDNTGDIAIRKSSDDGGTWGTSLDGTNSPTGASDAQNPSIAIDSNGLIGILWYDGTTTDEFRFTTFDTSTDQYNGGSAANEITVRSGVTISSSIYALACDSQDDFHAIYKDENDDDFYYNNSIDWATNEVVLAGDTQTGGVMDIAITSGDLPFIIYSLPTGGAGGSITARLGNARDATSFSSTLLVSSLEDAQDNVGSMAYGDNDDFMWVYLNNVTNELKILRGNSGDIKPLTPETLSKSSFGAGLWISACSNNNRFYIIFEDPVDDEIKFYESKNYGAGWNGPTAITSATTSDTPLLRACHGLHEGEPWRIDVIYRDAADDPQHAEISNATTINGDVNEKFEITSRSKEPGGTLINVARLKYVEAAPSPVISNEVSTGASGEDVTINYLRNLIEPNTTDGLTITAHTGTSIKSYKYGKLPFAFAFGNVDVKLDQTNIQLADIYQVEATRATAESAGDSAPACNINVPETNAYSILKYDTGVNTLNEGETITQATSGATGVVEAILEGDSVEGACLLRSRNVTAFDGTNTLSSSGTWTGNIVDANLQGGTKHTWEYDYYIECGSSATTRTAQVVYDWLNAEADKATADPANNFDDLVIAARGEFGLPLQGVATSPNKFNTIRNVALTSGWSMAHLTDLSEITGLTDNDGDIFIPKKTVTVTVTVVEAEDFVTPIVGARVNTAKQSDNSVVDNQLTNGSGIVTFAISLTANLPVFFRVRDEDERYVKVPGVIDKDSGISITVAVEDDNRYTMT